MGSHRVRHDRSDLAHMHASNKEGGKTNTGGRLFYKGDFPKVKAFKNCSLLQSLWGFPGDAMVKNPSAMQKHKMQVQSPGLERSPGVEYGNPLQYSCLGNPMDRGAWWATVHGVEKSWAQTNQASGLY